jgi:hypothetical protein
MYIDYFDHPMQTARNTMSGNNNNGKRDLSAYDMMKRDKEEETAKKFIGYVESYRCKEEDPLADYRYASSFWVSGYKDNPFTGVIPVGAKRLRFSFEYIRIQIGMSGYYNKVIGFPALNHQSHLGMTAHMFDQHEINYIPPNETTRNDQYKFSLLCVMYKKLIGPMLSRCGNAVVYNDFMQLTTLADMAVDMANRDIMAVMYAQVDMFMQTFFGIDFRTTQMLNFEELMDYLRDVLEKGPGVMLRPRPIHLIKGFKKPPTPIREDDEEDAEEDDAFYGGDDDDEFDGDPNPVKVLVLKTMKEVRQKITLDQYIPLSAPSHHLIEWQMPVGEKRKFTVVSLKDNHVKFPMPDLSDISQDEWHKFAVSRFVKRMFTKEKHYFCLMEMIIDEIRRFNASHADEKRRLFPVLLNESDTPRIVDLLVRDGTFIKELYTDKTRIYLDEAWKEQELIVDEVTKLVNEPIFLPRPVEETAAVIARFVEPGKTLTEEQIMSAHTSITKRISFIAGPGGSGKTVVMDVIQKMLRAMYPRQVFLFVSFKNGIVHNMREKIGDGACLSVDPPINENEFMTLDKLIWSGFCRSPHLTPTVVFMEESGQTCGAHMEGLFKAINFKKVTNFIMIGDANQRSPIRAGTPFRSLLRALNKEGFVTRLTKVHRTDAAVLRERQDAILQYNYPQVFEDTDDFSFRLHDMSAANNRMSSYVMTQYAQKMFEQLNTLKEAGIGCEDMMGICPYNDYCEVGNAVAAEFYFGGPDYLRVLPFLASSSDKSKKKPIPFYAVGMRVVFNKTKKMRDNPDDPSSRVWVLYSRGQVGILKSLSDVQRPKSGESPDEYAPIGTAIPNTKDGIPTGFTRHFVVAVGRDKKDEIRLSFDDMQGVRRIVSPANFITGDRAQGDEYEHVIGCFPWGNNLATNDVFYSICSRPKKSLAVIGSKSHLQKMILTPPIMRNWRLDDPGVIIIRPDERGLRAPPPVLQLEAAAFMGEVKTESPLMLTQAPLSPTQSDEAAVNHVFLVNDEFGVVDMSLEDMLMVDQLEVEHKDKKTRID